METTSGEVALPFSFLSPFKWERDGIVENNAMDYQFKGRSPAGTWRKNDVASTSMRRNHVASTLIRRHFGTNAQWEAQFPASPAVWMRA